MIGLPAGTIRLDRQLFIRRPRLILRGAGSGKTILRIDRPLKDTPGVTPPKGGYGFYNQGAPVHRMLADTSWLHAVSCLPCKAPGGNVGADAATSAPTNAAILTHPTTRRGVHHVGWAVHAGPQDCDCDGNGTQGGPQSDGEGGACQGQARRGWPACWELLKQHCWSGCGVPADSSACVLSIVLQVDTVSRMAVGQVVVLILSDKRGVLTRYL